MIVCIETHKQQLRFSVRGVGDNIGLGHFDFGIIDIWSISKVPRWSLFSGCFVKYFDSGCHSGETSFEFRASVNWKQADLVIWSNKFDRLVLDRDKELVFSSHLNPQLPKKEIVTRNLFEILVDCYCSLFSLLVGLAKPPELFFNLSSNRYRC